MAILCMAVGQITLFAHSASLRNNFKQVRIRILLVHEI